MHVRTRALNAHVKPQMHAAINIATSMQCGALKRINFND